VSYDDSVGVQQNSKMNLTKRASSAPWKVVRLLYQTAKEGKSKRERINCLQHNSRLILFTTIVYIQNVI